MGKENLKYYGKDKPVLSHAEAQRCGRMGGIKSGEKRRQLASFRQYLEIALEKTVKDKYGEEHSYKEIGAIRTAERYAQGDQRAQELVLKVLGEMPAERSEVTGVNGTPLNPPIINILPVTTKKDD